MVYTWYTLPNIYELDYGYKWSKPKFFSSYLKSTTVGLYSYYLNKSFSISPNPAYSVANVSYELEKGADVKISLVNGIGQIVEEVNFIAQTKGKYNSNFDVNKLSKGLYTLNLEINNQVITKKLMVE
jgi:Secretion system C-terminal sorting domain